MENMWKDKGVQDVTNNMPEKIWAAQAKNGSSYWTTDLHDAFTKDNCHNQPQEPYLKQSDVMALLDECDDVLESVLDLRDAMQIVGIWPDGLSISNIEQTLAKIKEFKEGL